MWSSRAISLHMGPFIVFPRPPPPTSVAPRPGEGQGEVERRQPSLTPLVTQTCSWNGSGSGSSIWKDVRNANSQPTSALLMHNLHLNRLQVVFLQNNISEAMVQAHSSQSLLPGDGVPPHPHPRAFDPVGLG